MRIIAGTARGIRLQAPKGSETRPTIDRVREALFSILGGRVEQARVLDLFAGTGAIGIEALSRGAAHVDFMESDARCLEVVEANIEAAKVKARAQVWRSILPQGLARLPGEGARYDLIFVDPPYEFAEYELLCAEIVDHALLAPDGLLIIEHDASVSLSGCLEHLDLEREARYGSSCLSFFGVRK